MSVSDVFVSRIEVERITISSLYLSLSLSHTHTHTHTTKKKRINNNGKKSVYSSFHYYLYVFFLIAFCKTVTFNTLALFFPCCSPVLKFKYLTHNNHLIISPPNRWDKIHRLFPLKRVTILLFEKRCILSMTLNNIRWWGFSSRVLESVEYLFIAFTPLLPLCGRTR